MRDIEIRKTRQILNEYVEEFENKFKDNLLKNNRKASGFLIDSVSVDVKRMGERWVMKLNVAEYYKYLRDGRKPNVGKQPPIDVILTWIKQKKIIPRAINGEKAPTEKQLAFLIARGIKRNGIKRDTSLQYTMSALNKKYKRLIIKSLGEDYSNFLKNNFRTIVLSKNKK